MAEGDNATGQATSPGAGASQGDEQPGLASRFGIISEEVLEQAVGESGSGETDPGSQAEPDLNAGDGAGENQDGEGAQDGESEETGDGGDGSGDGDGENVDPMDALHTVKVDGQDIEVPYRDLIANYSYRKYLTQENQRQSQEYAEAMAAAQQLQADNLGVLRQSQRILEALAPSEPDWDNMEPEKIPAAMKQYRAQKQVLEAVNGEIEKQEQEEQQQQLREFQAYSERESQLLMAQVPEWQDEAVRNRDLTDISLFAHDHMGYTPEEIQMIGYDHRNVLLLRMAKLGWEAQRARTGIQSQARQLETASGQAGGGNTATAEERAKQEDAELRRRASGPRATANDRAALLRSRHGAWMGLES